MGSIDGVCGLCSGPVSHLGRSLKLSEGGGCGRRCTLGRMSFRIRGKRAIKVVKAGNSNGSAVLGVVANMLSPATKRVTMGKEVSTLLRLKTKFGKRCSKLRGMCLGKDVVNFSERRVSTGLRSVLSFTSVNSFVCRPMGACSDNVFIHLTFTMTVGVSPRVLVISRTLSMKSMFFRTGYCQGFRRFGRVKGAVLFMDRSLDDVKGCYSHIMLLGGNRGLTRNNTGRVIGLCHHILIGRCSSTSLRRGASSTRRKRAARGRTTKTSISLGTRAKDNGTVGSDLGLGPGILRCNDGLNRVISFTVQSSANVVAGIVRGNGRFSIRVGIGFRTSIDSPVFTFALGSLGNARVAKAGAVCRRAPLGPRGTNSIHRVAFGRIVPLRTKRCVLYLNYAKCGSNSFAMFRHLCSIYGLAIVASGGTIKCFSLFSGMSIGWIRRQL